MIEGVDCMKKCFEKKAGMLPFEGPDRIYHQALMVDTGLGDGGLAVWVKNFICK
jgi:hypothetical protein